MLHDTLVRQYSLCFDPADRRHWKIGVLFPLQQAERYQFIAGGIGITPMIQKVDAQGAD